MFKYGSILMEVTCKPQPFKSAPMLLEITPLPIPLITPPVTSMYFILWVLDEDFDRSVLVNSKKTTNQCRRKKQRSFPTLLGWLLHLSLPSRKKFTWARVVSFNTLPFIGRSGSTNEKSTWWCHLCQFVPPQLTKLCVGEGMLSVSTISNCHCWCKQNSLKAGSPWSHARRAKWNLFLVSRLRRARFCSNVSLLADYKKKPKRKDLSF